MENYWYLAQERNEEGCWILWGKIFKLNTLLCLALPLLPLHSYQNKIKWCQMRNTWKWWFVLFSHIKGQYLFQNEMEKKSSGGEFRGTPCSWKQSKNWSFKNVRIQWLQIKVLYMLKRASGWQMVRWYFWVNRRQMFHQEFTQPIQLGRACA